MTTTMALFESHFKTFVSSTIIGPLADVAVKNRDLDQEGLIKKFMEVLDLPARSTPLVNVKPPRKRSPVVKQRWITMDEYKEQVKKHLLCSYVQTRGSNKDRYCGVVLDENTTVKLENDSFVPSSAEEELEAVKETRRKLGVSVVGPKILLKPVFKRERREEERNLTQRPRVTLLLQR